MSHVRNSTSEHARVMLQHGQKQARPASLFIQASTHCTRSFFSRYESTTIRTIRQRGKTRSRVPSRTSAVHAPLELYTHGGMEQCSTKRKPQELSLTRYPSRSVKDCQIYSFVHSIACNQHDARCDRQYVPLEPQDRNE